MQLTVLKGSVVMGQKDTVTIKYMRRNEVFADAFNYYIYNGEPVIDCNSHKEIDTRELEVPYGGEGNNRQPVQKARDVIKVAAMTDQKYAYLILALENQSNVHYAMPVRNMVYDALQYSKQVEMAAEAHRKNKGKEKFHKDEYLSGFTKKDRLIPVITLVIYFGFDEWDGPLSIHEMLKVQDPRILSFVPDYKMNLIAPYSIKEQELALFHSSLKEVLGFIKYSKDADKLEKFVNSNEQFKTLGRDEVNVLNACVKAEFPIIEGEEVTNVCEAIKELQERAAEKGVKEAEAAMALKMLHKKEPLNKIHEYTELPMEEILKIANENGITEI